MEISVGLFFARYKTVISAIALLIAGKVRGWRQADMLTAGLRAGEAAAASVQMTTSGSLRRGTPVTRVMCQTLVHAVGHFCSSPCAAHMQVGVMAAVGPMFGITRMQSIRAGMLLAAGGEFAFVAFGEGYCVHLPGSHPSVHC